MKMLYIPEEVESQQSWKILRPLQKALEVARIRMMVICACFIVAFMVITGRLFDVSIFRRSAMEGEFGSNARLSNLSFRSDIVDRNGELLATSLRTSSLYANAKVVNDPELAATQLLQVLPELNKKDIIQKLQTKKGFIWLVRHLAPTKQADIIRLGIPGLYFQQDERRVYPHGSLLSHVLGFTDVDNKGISGVEKKFNQQLCSDSKPLQLSVDLRLQHVLHDELLKGIDKFKAQGGAGIVMSVKTGEVVAMASLPDFDPNQVRKLSSDANALFNRISLGIYELGSSLKIINTALFLESKVANPIQQFDVTKPLRVGRFFITDYHPAQHPMNVPEIFVHSSNKGSALMAMLVGGDKQKEFFNKLGFFRPANLELPEIGSPLVPKTWSEATTITASYGYGVAISPLQLISAVSGIINNGIMNQPTLLKRNEGELTISQKVVSEQTSEAMKKLLYLVVSEGTGRKAAVSGYQVGGKTGTANTVQGKGYQKGKNTTSFIGAFPMRDPQYIVFIMIDRPMGIKETYYLNAAGWNAASVAGAVIARIAPLLKVVPVPEAQNQGNSMFIPISTKQ